MVREFGVWAQARREGFALAGRNWDLVLYRVYADLAGEAARTYARHLWWVLEPALAILTYYSVFHLILSVRSSDSVVFLVVGILLWRWFQASVMQGANSIMAERALMQQVRVSKLVFPLTAVLSNTVRFLVVFSVLLVFLWWRGHATSPHALALPALLLILFAVITGCTLMAASVVPFVPDLRTVLDNVLRLLFFVSGVVFPLQNIPAPYQSLAYLNPIAVVIDAFRDVLIVEKWPQWGWLAGVFALSLALVAAAAAIVARYDDVYPELE
ncbi:MAG TPA: ABC transporter permease [Acidobacteriota bacterium]|nr:ABC transporter permease [Acidobacteriota bacterium]